MTSEQMTHQQLLDAVNAAGITPEELTATLRGGAISVRRTTKQLQARAAREAGQRAAQEAEARAQALEAEIAQMEAAQVAAIAAQVGG